MTATPTLHVTRTSPTSSPHRTAGAAAVPAPDHLVLQVALASGLGATLAVLGTWAIVATQTLQMHF
jgi:hypothetical protein